MLSRSGGDGDVPRAVGAHSRQPRGIANAELLTVLSTGADVCSAAVRDRAGGRRDRQGRDEASNPAEVPSGAAERASADKSVERAAMPAFIRSRSETSV
jgi:hypothetical protein